MRTNLECDQTKIRNVVVRRASQEECTFLNLQCANGAFAKHLPASKGMWNFCANKQTFLGNVCVAQQHRLTAYLLGCLRRDNHLDLPILAACVVMDICPEKGQRVNCC
jgi:hypothetical protein